MALGNVERVVAPAHRQFESAFLIPQRPVIMTDVFRGQPLEHLRTLSSAVRRLDKVKLEIREESFTRFESTGSLGDRSPVVMTVAEYADHARNAPATRLMCSDFPSPREVCELFRVPSYCSYNYRVGGILSRFFFGNRGNVAHLHYDGDHRHVLLTQITGRKRVVLFSPGIAKALNPILNFSTLILERMPTDEKLSFLRYHGAFDCMIHPGDTIYIPPLMWHYVEYLDTGMSFNLRFGLDPRSHQFTDLHAGTYTQNVAWHVLRRPKISRRWREALTRLRATRARRFKSAFEKYLHIEGLLQSIYGELCTDSLQGEYWFANRDQIERSVRQHILEGGLYQENRMVC